jgi:hypothetical protein
MALLALLLFGAWLGSAVLHEHPGPPCQICKDLQASQVDVVSPLDPPRLDSPPERLTEAVVVENPALLLAAPTGRGPPQA